MKYKAAAARVPNYPGREALERALGPLIAPLTSRVAGHMIGRLLGFWVLQASYGDHFALIESGVSSRANVYKQLAEFRDVFGVDVADFLPEIAAQLRDSGLALKVGTAETPDAVAQQAIERRVSA
jgi:hypothetical protein